MIARVIDVSEGCWENLPQDYNVLVAFLESTDDFTLRLVKLGKALFKIAELKVNFEGLSSHSATIIVDEISK